MFKSNFNDISFQNIFWKKMVQKLIVLLVVSIAAIVFVNQYIEKNIDRTVKEKLTSLSLQLAQMEDQQLPEDQFALDTNILLSQLQDELNKNKFIDDASLSFYDLTNDSVIAKSFAIPVLKDENAKEWWKEKDELNKENPVIVLSNEMIAFCKQYDQEYDLVMENVAYINHVLKPAKIMAQKNGTTVAECTALIQQVEENDMYKDSIPFDIIGNQSEDVIYGLMNTYKIEPIQNAEETNSNQSEKPQSVSYDNMKDKEPSSSQDHTSNEKKHVTYPERLTKYATNQRQTFEINQKDFSLDCSYSLAIWQVLWWYTLLGYLLFITVAAVLSYISTKSMLTIYSK